MNEMMLIKPLDQLVIQRNALSKEREFVLDKLNPDLSYKKTIAAAPEASTLEEARDYFISQGKVPPGRWIKVQREYTMLEAWKKGMESFRQQVRSKC